MGSCAAFFLTIGLLIPAVSVGIWLAHYANKKGWECAARGDEM